jgi:hypothetical protein
MPSWASSVKVWFGCRAFQNIDGCIRLASVKQKCCAEESGQGVIRIRREKARA